ncbi:TRAP transporter small permease [Halalkalibacter okhensis]|uniref:C4-dicarboxylate ABC transporter permease n=1 Tax=Halalkalibacter okhensis TaxID=333138 RepID=A0A0B0IF09_9BACI|nr:TRAP transporter small permease [Halalkalibacter okhensis]KHF39447.1 C4-dicarboxylate ABC transporter permease [Halalkalibacter okhensis]
MKKLVKVIDHLEEYFGFFSLIIASLLIFVQVVLRYVFNYSLYWSEEVARYLIIWFIFIGSSIAVREKSHATVDLLLVYLPPVFKRILSVLGSVIAIIFFSFIIQSGIKTIENVVQFNNVTPALGIPMFIPYLAIPVGSALMILRFIQLIIAELRDFKNDLSGQSPKPREGE